MIRRSRISVYGILARYLQTNRQLQQIRPYYQFHDADIDRYLLSEEANLANADKQQVIIASQGIGLCSSSRYCQNLG